MSSGGVFPLPLRINPQGTNYLRPLRPLRFMRAMVYLQYAAANLKEEVSHTSSLAGINDGSCDHASFFCT
jgi:hypothetical protein